MGSCFHRINNQIHIHLLLSLLLLSSTQVRNSAEGRPVFKLLETKTAVDSEQMLAMGTIIGSRPPRCEGMCATCGHCVAVQIPAFPRERSGAGHHLLRTISPRGYDSSNYKPMSWKCKCGGMILNP